ncbi:MAG: hypothetical protein JNK27_11260 [Chitinophagaceae bacterium]|nr:hypothetical protein [Chitinophagaceae bacterium]
MKYIKFLPSLVLLVIATSCGNSSDEETTTTPANTSSAVPPAATNGADTARMMPVQQQPVVNTVTPVNAGNQPSAPVISKVGLNPAHGQPGHRCDIPVGAPLDGKPSQPATITPKPSPVAPVINTNPAQGAATGLNPAHGQPGHRCDIAVGAPLNSKPTQK